MKFFLLGKFLPIFCRSSDHILYSATFCTVPNTKINDQIEAVQTHRIKLIKSNLGVIIFKRCSIRLVIIQSPQVFLVAFFAAKGTRSPKWPFEFL